MLSNIFKYKFKKYIVFIVIIIVIFYITNLKIENPSLFLEETPASFYSI